MKVRAQRTHLMGSSNRSKEAFDANYKTQSVFEKSFNKSKSLYYPPMDKTLPAESTAEFGTRVKPFLGTHSELQTRRFDKNNLRPFKQREMMIPRGTRQISLAPHLNEQVRDIQKEFGQKAINLHKLRELKHSFVKNNRDRRDLEPYFKRFANEEGIINAGSLRKIVKEYGFDISEDQAKLIFRLTARGQPESVTQNGLKINGFVELMTKDDIFYRTLKLQNKQSAGQKPVKHFSDKMHQILRNKFPRLKEALKIHQTRHEDIDYERFLAVMKKLDLTELVVSDQEKKTLFEDYSENGALNPEALICAIAEQEHGIKPKKDTFRDFSDNLNVVEQKKHLNSQKVRGYSLKDLTDLEYENQLGKAQSVMNQLKRIRKKNKAQNQNGDLFDRIQGSIQREELSRLTEQILQKEGINFHKEDYDAFVACMDFDVNGEISKQKVNETVFWETQKQARNRFERKTRNQAPKPRSNQDYESDEQTAHECINRLRDHKMNPENRQLFKEFDKDMDGYICEKELKESLSAMAIMEDWQVNNLVSYLGIKAKGGISFSDFTAKLNPQPINQNQLPSVSFRNSRSCQDWSHKTSDKRSFIQAANQSAYQRPTKYSAWPEQLTAGDLSLIQAPPSAGTYASADERFRERRDDYGLKQKRLVQAVAEKKRQRIAEWNHKLQNRVKETEQLLQQRQAARNFSLRLAQETYEENCHK